MSVKIVLLRFLILYIYLVTFGALMFAIEKTNNEDEKEKRKDLEKLWTTLNSSYNMTRNDFEKFAETAHRSLTPSKPKWTFRTGLHFAISVCTTIGKVAKCFISNKPPLIFCQF